MKPDWRYAPEWANYLAMDEDGTWYWFEDEPVFRAECWRVISGAVEQANQALSASESLEQRGVK